MCIRSYLLDFLVYVSAFLSICLHAFLCVYQHVYMYVYLSCSGKSCRNVSTRIGGMDLDDSDFPYSDSQLSEMLWEGRLEEDEPPAFGVADRVQAHY
jgi:hypothetical protein